MGDILIRMTSKRKRRASILRKKRLRVQLQILGRLLFHRKHIHLVSQKMRILTFLLLIPLFQEGILSIVSKVQTNKEPGRDREDLMNSTYCMKSSKRDGLVYLFLKCPLKKLSYIFFPLSIYYRATRIKSSLTSVDFTQNDF